MSSTSASVASSKMLRSFSKLPISLRQNILRHPNIKSSTPIYSQAVLVSARNASSQAHSQPPNPSQAETSEPLVPPPSPTSGPLLSRLPNRALPDIQRGLSASTRLWLKTLPIFIIICALGSLSIFNYQKSSSSTVSSILYAMRTSPTVRALLGDEIYFASRIPWIHGELNQLHGNINISFWVKGNKGQGLVRFVSVRRRREGYFETLEWSLKTEDGRVVQLLDTEGRDPMSGARQEYEDARDVVV